MDSHPSFFIEYHSARSHPPLRKTKSLMMEKYKKNGLMSSQISYRCYLLMEFNDSVK